MGMKRKKIAGLLINAYVKTEQAYDAIHKLLEYKDDLNPGVIENPLEVIIHVYKLLEKYRYDYQSEIKEIERSKENAHAR